MGNYGQELPVDILGQMLGVITHLCGALCATPPTSIVGVILWTGYVGESVLSHLHTGQLPIAFISFGLCLALMAALGLRDKSSPQSGRIHINAAGGCNRCRHECHLDDAWSGVIHVPCGHEYGQLGRQGF
jgi:hypothetical protein